ncbi:hypothetical protein HMPREF1550_02621 [Actinomyces sp. oral taxon 877 str. F0543]|nr:hypothetical protein HMPREF1550_02621 [Actinomyces sp. oral taxon 877 str. F0543]
MAFISLRWGLSVVGVSARGAGGPGVAGGADGPRGARPVVRAWRALRGPGQARSAWWAP